MSIAVLEEIIEKLGLLSEAEQQKLVEVVEQQKQMKAEAERRVFIRSLRGKYKDVMPNPELRAKWKAEEIELEDRGKKKCQPQF